MNSRQIKAGRVPTDWSGMMFCHQCIAVPCHPALDGELYIACPWCHVSDEARTVAKARMWDVQRRQYDAEFVARIRGAAPGWFDENGDWIKKDVA